MGTFIGRRVQRPSIHLFYIFKTNGRVVQYHNKTQDHYDIAEQLTRASSPDTSAHLASVSWVFNLAFSFLEEQHP